MSWIIQRDSYQKINREMDSLYQNYSTTDFHRKAQAVASNIQKISQNVTSITRMVGQIGSSHDSSPELRSQLHKITHYTGQLAKDTTEDLKELNKFNLSDQRELKLKREKLTSDFSAVLNSFQNIQRTAAQKEKESLKASAGKSSTTPYLEGPPGSGQSQSQFRQQQQTQAMFDDMQDEEQAVESIRQREQAIRQLESDILDVNQIFKELATMVHEQGEMVDSIEAHVESAQIEVTEGASEIARAHTYQNKARKKKLFLLIAGIVVVLVLILILSYS